MQPGPARAFPRRVRNGHWFHHSRTNAGESYLRWGRLFEFLVSADGRTIRYRLLERTSLESLSTYLLGQALSFSLIARGVDPLHGTAVAVNGGAVVFLGDCGAGKSTLGAAMLARGFPIVTDDLVAIERRGGEYVIHPGPARVKLFPGVARRLMAGRRGTPMVRGTSKLILPLDPAEMASGPLPVRAFYVLGTSPRGVVRVESLDPGGACVELVRGAFNLSVTDRKRLANQFQFVTRLARTVPVHRLTYPRALAALPTVVDAILADLRTV